MIMRSLDFVINNDFIDGEFVSYEYFSVPESFLNELLENDLYFEQLKEFFSGNYDFLSLKKGDDTEEIYAADLMHLFDLAYANGVLGNSEKSFVVRERYNDMFNNFHLTNYLDNNKDTKYSIDVLTKEISVTYGDILKFLELSEDEFEEFIALLSGPYKDGISNREFCYAVQSFLNEKNVLERFAMDEQMMTRVNDLLDPFIFDFSSYGFKDNHSYEKISDYEISNELKSLILDDIPDEFDNIDKAIYIYTIMCKLLNYDESFYAGNQTGKELAKHGDPNYLKTIDSSNLNAVCWEFSTIYAQLLHEIGIPCNLYSKQYDYSNGGKPSEIIVPFEYGNGHSFLTFSCDEFLVEADSAASVLYGDMSRGKMGLPILGLKSINNSYDLSDEFDERVRRVEEYINSRTKDNTDISTTLNALHVLSSDQNTIPLSEKIEIFLDKVQSSCLEGVAAQSYLFFLRNNIFNKKEKTNNFACQIVEEHDDDSFNAVGVFCFNPLGFVYLNRTDYYTYSPRNGVTPIRRGDLQKKFDTMQYFPIKLKTGLIPGIDIFGAMDNRGDEVYDIETKKSK